MVDQPPSVLIEPFLSFGYIYSGKVTKLNRIIIRINIINSIENKMEESPGRRKHLYWAKIKEHRIIEHLNLSLRTETAVQFSSSLKEVCMK